MYFESILIAKLHRRPRTRRWGTVLDKHGLTNILDGQPIVWCGRIISPASRYDYSAAAEIEQTPGSTRCLKFSSYDTDVPSYLATYYTALY